MAFQLKQEHHLDKGIYLELLDNPINAQVKLDQWKNEKFTIPIKCIGNDVTDGSGIKWFYSERDSKWVFLNDGKDTDIELTKYQYEKLVKYDKGSKVQVMMKEMQGAKGEYTGLDVKPLNDAASEVSVEVDSKVATDTPKAVNIPNKVPYSNDDRDMQIKWGMCLKEATNLSIAMCANEKEPNYLQSINYLTFKLMDIAVDGFKEWEKEYNEKDQNSAPNDDDLPF